MFNMQNGGMAKKKPAGPKKTGSVQSAGLCIKSKKEKIKYENKIRLGGNMSVPLYSCTCEARFVFVSTPPYTEERFNASIYWKRISTPHILEARL